MFGCLHFGVRRASDFMVYIGMYWGYIGII